MVGRDVFQMRRRMSLACVLTVSPDQPGHRHLSFAAPSTQVIPSNFQIRGMHTIIRDRGTSTPDFVFYSDRLLRLVVEASLGHLPFRCGGAGGLA